MIRAVTSPIRTVLVYAGHKNHPLLGPYAVDVPKQIAMFNRLNGYRKWKWEVKCIEGERLLEVLRAYPPFETLLVIPPGPSSHLDQVFTAEEKQEIGVFVYRGARLFTTCGGAYGLCDEREFEGVAKKGSFPLFFPGKAVGPLSRHPEYETDCHAKAVTVTDGKQEIALLVNGGGCLQSLQSNVRVLLTYSDAELSRYGKTREWKNAAVLVKMGQGAALFTMPHLDYGPEDINVEGLTQLFPHAGIDWSALQKRLCPTKERDRFILDAIIAPLEE